jgi:hypothetical protein
MFAFTLSHLSAAIDAAMEVEIDRAQTPSPKIQAIADRACVVKYAVRNAVAS